MKIPTDNDTAFSLDINGQSRQNSWFPLRQSGRLLLGAGMSMFRSFGLFITDVKSLTFLTKVKHLPLQPISQIKSLGKNGVEEDKEGEEINEQNAGVFCL